MDVDTQWIQRVGRGISDVGRRVARIEGRLDAALPPIQDRLNILDERLCEVEKDLRAHSTNHHGTASTVKRNVPITTAVASLIFILYELVQKLGIPHVIP